MTTKITVSKSRGASVLLLLLIPMAVCGFIGFVAVTAVTAQLTDSASVDYICGFIGAAVSAVGLLVFVGRTLARVKN